MQFRAFSSRIESRALGSIALLSLLPIAVLAFAAWQQMQRLTVDHFEHRLSQQLHSYTSDLNQRLASFSHTVRLSDNPAVLKKLLMINDDPDAVPPSSDRLTDTSKPHLIFTESRLWIAVRGRANTNILEINQTQLLKPLQRAYPKVDFCISFTGTYAPNCHNGNPKDHAVSLKRPLQLGSRFATNFDAWIIVTAPSEVAAEGSPEFMRSMFITLFLASLIAIGASTLANRRVLAPLEEFSRGTKALLEHDYDVELKIDSEDEFGELGRAFNSMTENLRASNRLTAALSQVDQLILKTTDMERVIRSVLNAIRRIEANPAWVLTFGHRQTVG